MNGMVTSVSKNVKHGFTKHNVDHILLLEGKGVEGDAHCGPFVKHRSRVRQDPSQPNLRQVHLIHEELFEELAENGFVIEPGQIGENITTRAIDLLSLPKGTLLNIGDDAIVEITGLRNPCQQLNSFQEGLMQQLVFKDENGELVRKAGIMGVVLQDGLVRINDRIVVTYPAEPHQKLERV